MGDLTGVRSSVAPVVPNWNVLKPFQEIAVCLSPVFASSRRGASNFVVLSDESLP